MSVTHMNDRQALLDRIQELEATLAEEKSERVRLSQNVEVLKRMIWGGSEKRSAADSPLMPGQLLLAGILEGALRGPESEGATSSSEIKDAPKSKRKRKKGRRSSFPDHLPVLETTFELSEEDRQCPCGGELTPMGHETSKELERVEFSLVHEMRRVKYCCRSCQENVVTAPGPDRVIDKGILGVGFLAHLLTERFKNHMPYHRLEKKYESEGLSLSRSVLCTSAIRCAELLEPIAEQIKDEILGSGIVHTDDTPVTMLKDSTGVTRTGRVWIYRDIDGRCYFDFTESRSRDGPQRILGDYEGYLVADAFPGYDKFFTHGSATEVACWAHARRKFVTATSSEPDLANEALDLIGTLYGIEKRGKEIDVEARRALRRKESVPALKKLREWFATTRPTLLDQGALAQAIDYALSNWDALVRYTDDGRLPIDNNAAERDLRAVAVGRKNWMFAGNQNGGNAAAVLYGLSASCAAAGVNPREYFQDVLLRISTESDASKLTPHAWKKHFLPEVQRRRHDALRRIFGEPAPGALG